MSPRIGSPQEMERAMWRLLRGKNRLAACFDSQHLDVSLGPLGRRFVDASWGAAVCGPCASAQCADRILPH